MQLDHKMKMKMKMKTEWDVRNEVIEILRQRGFHRSWYACTFRCAVKRGELWLLTPFDTCNWIIRK